VTAVVKQFLRVVCVQYRIFDITTPAKSERYGIVVGRRTGCQFLNRKRTWKRGGARTTLPPGRRRMRGRRLPKHRQTTRCNTKIEMAIKKPSIVPAAHNCDTYTYTYSYSYSHKPPFILQKCAVAVISFVLHFCASVRECVSWGANVVLWLCFGCCVDIWWNKSDSCAQVEVFVLRISVVQFQTKRTNGKFYIFIPWHPLKSVRGSAFSWDIQSLSIPASEFENKTCSKS